MPEIETAHGLIHYTDTGAGLPVVMVHATLHDHRDYDPIVGPIARSHRAIAIDWPHHGLSSGSGERPTATDLAETLQEIVEALSLGPSVVIGNSVGGYAAARLALDKPEAVAGLVLVNTGGFMKFNPMSRTFCRLMGRPAFARRVLPRLVDRYMRAQSESDRMISQRVKDRAAGDGAEVAASLWRSFLDPAFDLGTRAAKIEAPTLLMWGVQDNTTPLKDGKRADTVLPHSSLHEFETGHLPFSSQPREFLDVVLPFLNDPGRARQP